MNFCRCSKIMARLQICYSASRLQTATAFKQMTLHVFKHCKMKTTHHDEDCYHLEKNEDKGPQYYKYIMDKQAKAKLIKERKLNDVRGAGLRTTKSKQLTPK